MSETSSKSASLVTVAAIFVLFALFAVLVRFVYGGGASGLFVGDGIHTVEQREKILADLNAKHDQQLSSYAWVDQKAGVVQLPIQRAEELTLQHYAKKP
jgi:hypothetical protein